MVFVQKVNDTIERVIEQHAALPYDRNNLSKLSIKDIQFIISDQLFLDVLLMEIHSKSIAFATVKKKRAREQEQKLENEIRLVERKVDKTEEDLDNVKVKSENLVDIRQKKTECLELDESQREEK